MSSKIALILILLLASVLRLSNLDKVPVSLFGDELDVGYHAYSILKTGEDYSGNPWPLHFQSLAEWRTPLYLYSAVPTVAIFGLNEWGVRLPAAIFGILGVFVFYLLVKELRKNHLKLESPLLEITASLLLTISPWHIQYSRAAFEVTQLLFFLILGLYLFLVSLKNGKWLWASVAAFCLTPWIYSTAKVFAPILMLFLFLFWMRDILKISKKYLIFAVAAGIIIGLPAAYSTVFGGGATRFNYISIFSDPTTEPEVGTARLIDAGMRGETGTGLEPTPLDRVVHNKFTYWGGNILNNYYQTLSTNFLFIEGDPNLRHSIKGVGQFYKIEIVALVIGIIFFFANAKNKSLKTLLAFWILAGIVPSALTRDGGNHATRLILILPPLIFLISYGVNHIAQLKPLKMGKTLMAAYFMILAVSFLLFMHSYWVHSPWDTERWWHSGFKQAIQSVKDYENDYSKVVISTANEPPWVFFAAWYQYPPDKWHQGYPFKTTTVEGFGQISYIDKYYFGTAEGGVYDWGKVLDTDTLYVAVAKEVNVNLIREPERTPKDLNLIKAIAYPSGEPAFYLVSKKVEVD